MAPGDVLTSSSAPPLPEEPTPAEQSPVMAPSPYPFGLRNAAATFASAYASAHTEPLGRHQRFALDLFATTSTPTHTDSSEEDEAWAGADFSGLRDPKLCASSWPRATTASATLTSMMKALTIPLESASTSGSGC